MLKYKRTCTENEMGETMETYEVLSHLTKKEWKKSWGNRVVEDTKANLRSYHSKNCYFGHFINNDEFVLYYHKEFEGNSLNTYFHGSVEKCDEGCRVTGHFAKKRTANIFLLFAAVLTGLTTLVMAYNGNFQMMAAPAVLCAIVLLCYFVTPKNSKERLEEGLKEISFADIPRAKAAGGGDNRDIPSVKGTGGGDSRGADALTDHEDISKKQPSGSRKAKGGPVSLGSITKIKTAEIEKKETAGKDKDQ